MAYFLQIQNLEIKAKILMERERLDEVVYIFSSYVLFGRMSKEVKFMILKWKTL